MEMRYRGKMNVTADPPSIPSPPGASAVVGDSGDDMLNLRLRTLVWLRWLAVAGQTGAVLAVYYYLGFDLPLGFCLTLVAISAWLNIFLLIRARRALRLEAGHATALLAYDVAQLAALLFLTGGLENPFAVLMLVPVTVAASVLRQRNAAMVAGLAVALISILAFHHQPLPWYADAPLDLPNLYVAGMWTALACGIGFATLYAGRVADESRQMSQALAATEAVLAREQQLSALDGLAAAAAHELGTPLATISLVAKELKRDHGGEGEIADDLDLLYSQAERCRAILARLANRDAQSDAMYASLRLTVLIAEVCDAAEPLDIEIAVTTTAGAGREPVLARNPAIKYALANLLDNALDFASRKVEIDMAWNEQTVAVTMRDDGPGFAEAIIDRLGDPYVTSRPGYDGTALAAQPGHHGMGLGFFIAKTLLERSGATVTLANRAGGKHGAIVHILWPRERIDVAGDGD